MFDKLVIIHYSPLSQRWYDYLCFEELAKAFDLEYWDCSSFVFPKFVVTKPIVDRHVRKIHDTQELEEYLKAMPIKSLVSVDIHRREENYKVLRLISKYRRTVVFMDFFSNSIRQSRKAKFIDDYTSIQNLRRKFFSLVFRSMFHVIRISCDFNAQYRINHPDYEYYLQTRNFTPVLPQKRYVVYIDNNFPFHPEIKFTEPYLDITEIARGFYSSLNAYFDKVEREYDCEVVIAAHPAANYTSNPFNGRKLIVNKTALLVRDSIGVLIHTSNAISFAYMYKKQVVFLHNKSFRQSKIQFRRLKECSMDLHFPLIDTDVSTAEGIFDYQLSEEERMRYIHHYLVDINDTRSNKEKLIERIQQVAHSLNL